MIERLALLSFRRRWTTLLTWVVIVVAAIGASAALAGDFADGGRLTGTDSDAAYASMAAHFPNPDGESTAVAFADRQGLARAEARTGIDRFLSAARAVPNVLSVTGPDQLSRDGTVGVGNVTLTGTAEQRQDAADRLRSLADAARTGGLSVDFTGNRFTEGGLDSTGEIIGVVGAIVILLLAFGSAVVMGVPIISALIGVAVAGSGVGLWAAVAPTPDFTTEVALMIGLGVGIDYALFFIMRYRSALVTGATPSQAIAEAARTAGRAVVFAGSIVMVSLLGMVLMRMPFLYGLAFASATAVLVAICAALTLVPALLGIMGRRIGGRALRAAQSGRETSWHRWARFVQRHAAASAIAGTTLLMVAAAPVLWMRLATADQGSDPVGTTTRVAHDELASAFGPGVNGPLVLVSPSSPDVLRRTTALVKASKDVVSVSAPEVSADGAVALVTVIPVGGPQDRSTTSLVHHLRASFRDAGLPVHVGGQTASDVDFASLMSDGLPVFIGAVLIVSFVLLLMVFRSVLVPLKAVLLNLLSIAASYGLMVAVFQWGWLCSLLGVERGAPIEPWAPMMLFAIVFGLSMDYEVFLLSSIQERYLSSRDNRASVVEGLSVTARVITAAAAIMVLVFGGFVLNDVRSVKLIGFGLASAVLVDATVVRMLLVPAMMQLLGDRNWWMPAWLDRLLPSLAVEQHGPAVARPVLVDLDRRAA